jgi:hypothetical protein
VRLITQDALIVCDHKGVVKLVHRQSYVTIAGRLVLIDPDPEQRTIDRCPNRAPPMKQCTTTWRVESGYSQFVRIDGHRACLATVTGHTDGMPVGAVFYRVNKPGQTFVSASA